MVDLAPLDPIRPEIFSNIPWVRCGVSKRGTVSDDAPFGFNTSFRVGDRKEAVEENRRKFLRSLGAPSDRLVTARQCHTAHVAVVTDPGELDETDGLATDRRDLWLAVSVADCVPLFLVDTQRKAVAAVHAGWRGSAAQIASGAVSVMQKQFSSEPGTMFAFIGPSAGPCCYNVGEDVASLFSKDVVESRKRSLYLDLKKENKRQLMHAGLSAKNIETSGFCTICTPGLQSYRRDNDRSGRMMGVIGIL